VLLISFVFLFAFSNPIIVLHFVQTCCDYIHYIFFIYDLFLSGNPLFQKEIININEDSFF